MCCCRPIRGTSSCSRCPDDQTYKPAGVNATLEIIRAWTSAVPKGKLLLLDLWADSTPLWNISRSFFGTDYIWCMCAAQSWLALAVAPLPRR